MKDIYKVTTHPEALADNMVCGGKYRITVLTDCLIRMEYSEDGVFEDRPTQMVFDRDFPKVDFRVKRTEDGLEITTSCLHLTYNEKEFSAHGLGIELVGFLSFLNRPWHYGDQPRDLGGTARTLDEANGAIPLDHGVASAFGWSLLDDSHSQVLLEDGWIEPRKTGISDLYFFGYGHDYKAALQDFYHLCGRTPMLPRYALGNWWSRYYKYTEQSYMELMERFDEENLPFTVAVIDMDWHLVDIDPKYGSGWTGYTWNRAFFPDPERFLKRLHDRGMRTTLNLHPAEGVFAHEEAYPAMAKALGVDYEHEEPIPCDVASPEYLDAYFTYLHHPLEEQGVDFWWIDWQQGTHTKIEGLDPLWILNHFHYLDSERDGKRGMMFSRYAGPGSHRYPVGFSGDTVITWESLDFQPYFTSTASNIGYGWWSHDIGGHMMGYKNDEMETRWYQFGAYSPIMRLHSTASEFNGKEPWRFKKECEIAMGEILRERHRMVPYLYTMNYRAYQENVPLVLPLYYEYPREREAYVRKNQYFFGTELMVAAVTTPRIKGLNVSRTAVWMPEGTWYDIHTGMIYEGGRTLDMYRDLNSIPVLAKAGAILPFTEEISGVQAGRNPESLHIRVFAGADGSFTLYEDDNETCAYRDGVCVKSHLEYQDRMGTEGGESVFTIHPSEGDLSLIPEKRSYTVELTGFAKEAADTVRVLVNGTLAAKDQVQVLYNRKKQAVVVTVEQTPVSAELQVALDAACQTTENDVAGRCFDFLNQAEIEFGTKDQVYRMVAAKKSAAKLLSELNAAKLDADLYGVLVELVTA